MESRRKQLLIPPAPKAEHLAGKTQDLGGKGNSRSFVRTSAFERSVSPLLPFSPQQSTRSSSPRAGARRQRERSRLRRAPRRRGAAAGSSGFEGLLGQRERERERESGEGTDVDAKRCGIERLAGQRRAPSGTAAGGSSLCLRVATPSTPSIGASILPPPPSPARGPEGATDPTAWHPLAVAAQWEVAGQAGARPQGRRPAWRRAELVPMRAAAASTWHAFVVAAADADAMAADLRHVAELPVVHANLSPPRPLPFLSQRARRGGGRRTAGQRRCGWRARQRQRWRSSSRAPAALPPPSSVSGRSWASRVWRRMAARDAVRPARVLPSPVSSCTH
ncbi:hypothetical protein PVAP13_9NG401028 [Panicum virgatum]|uniref:Uncharacterized protein n=1 Tax=Panicum virgatum TaxID=38727 RepID=A0A8T0MSR5_PANVG|nr:hypothetical protein PVAP13_9NG401028 [Panicum virgatum]